MNNKRVKFLNSYVDALTMDETIVAAEQIISRGIPTQHVVINASKMYLMNKDEKIKDIINNCELINADGMSIVWGANFLGKKLPERVAGFDLFLELVKVSAAKGYKPYFFGATQEVVEKVVCTVKEKYPTLNIAGYRNGYFSDDESPEIAREINESGADILFVAFSSPMKELWIEQYLEQTNVPFAMGVGGSFDVIAGKTQRAPIWMQKAGLEWFYRFIQEPRRMFKRNILSNSSLIYRVLKEKIKISKNHRKI